MVISYEVLHFVPSRFNHNTHIKRNLNSELYKMTIYATLRLCYFLLVVKSIVGSNRDSREMYRRSVETTLHSIHNNPSSAFTLTPSGLHPPLTYISNVPRWCMKASNVITYVTLEKGEILKDRKTIPVSSFGHFALRDTRNVIHFARCAR